MTRFWLTLTALLLFTASLVSAGSIPRGDGAEVPIREYGAPLGCAPLAVLSPGFGSTERGLAVYATALASSGYRVIVMGHKQSGPVQLRAVVRSSNWRKALKNIVGDTDVNAARHMDLDAAWAAAITDCTPPFAVMLGHSMGAQTTLIEAGAVFNSGQKGADRFDAYIALSPPGIGARFTKDAWREIYKPTLMITGTKDSGIRGDYKNRLTPFAGLPDGFHRLAVLKGANHKNVGGRGGPHPALISSIILEFLATVRNGSFKPAMTRPGVKFTNK